MKHLDLFSGIGGFSLAADRVWKNVEHTFVENDPFCQEILKKHWPRAALHGDIRQFSKARITPDSRSKESGGVSNQPRTQGAETGDVYLLTGGFPCQPFSQAGRRKGTEDDRHLWPEMFRVIREFKPRWVVGENVAGFVTWNNGLVLRQALTDLEGEGYEVQAFVIPAVALNAPHRRDRIWIVAHCGRKLGQGHSKPRVREKNKSRAYDEYKYSNPSFENRSNWNESWLEVATRLCRVDDGLPRRLDRNPRLKALGNAIVPQVAEEIFKAIKEITP